MRLAEDSSNWHASSIRRRDFRHTHAEPEIPTGHPKRRNRNKQKINKCYHVWVEVDYSEYQRYGRWYPDNEIAQIYTRYFVCPGCNKTTIKIDKSKWRIYGRKQGWLPRRIRRYWSR